MSHSARPSSHSHRNLSRRRQLDQQRKLRMRRRLLQPEALEARQMMAGDVTGTVFNDLNANGLDDAGDVGLAGWTVYVDANGNGALDSGERSTLTDSKGKYSLLGIPAGNVTVYDIPQAGFRPTPGFTDHQVATVRDNKETRVKFGNVTAPVTTGQISGQVFEDTNENGVADSGEEMLEGWTLFLDTNGDGAMSVGEPTTTTNADGDFQFAGVAAGPVNVYEIPVGGLLPTVGGLFPRDGALDHHLVNVVTGATARTSFANLLPQVGTIQGTVWQDSNGDGLRGAGESPLAGQSVYIDLNNNGILDSGEPARVTDAAGGYSFVNIHTGTYRVTDILPAGYIAAEGKPAAVTSSVFRGSLNVVDFYNLVPTTGSIDGAVWNDADGNGVRGADELGLAGRQVFVDLNTNGLPDATEPQQLTEVDGSYSFSAIAYGTATVREVLPADWIATNPAAGATTFRLLNGEARQNVNFGNRERVGIILGTVWNDANGDRVRSADETGLSDWNVFLDLNADGLQDPAEPTATTAADGTYRFNRVPVGSYRVVEGVVPGWITAEGKPAVVTTTVTIGSLNTADFYNLVPVEGSISGSVWSDLDANGIFSAAEIGVEGWQVYVDLNSNNLPDAGEPQALTDASGNYILTGVPYGTSTVRETIQPGYTATNGSARTSLLLNGENRTGVNFGVKEPTDYVISGVAYNDANRNGQRDAGENGLSGITVFLDTNNNGALDAGEPATTTSTDHFFTPAVNELGTYSFTHLARGNYSVREVVPDTLSATAADASTQTVSVGPASAANVNFANNYRPNEIHGVVFDDTDADQVQDASERGRGGVGIYLDLDRDDLRDTDEPYTLTGDDGAYAFVGLTPGAYVVREDHGVPGSYTYPATGGGTLWPAGLSNPAIGNVTPTSITTSLAQGENFLQTVSLTLPDAGSLSSLVDVFLLFDDTGSFTANSPLVRAAFPTIISSLQASLPGVDLGFGVGRLEEYGNFASEFATGRPFILNQPIVASSTPGFSTSIQAALDRMAPGYGGDAPETDIEALYQLVTGLGFDGNNDGSVLGSGPAGLASTQLNPGASGDVPSFASFVADPASNVLPAAGNVGGGGFRPGALPIVLLATDTGFAYQPRGESSIVGAGGLSLPLSALTQASRPTTPFNAGAGIQDTVTALNALGALVIGLGTNADAAIDPRQGLESLAQLTGAINRSAATIANGTADPIAPGDPLYFQINSGFGATVADGVTNAIQNAATTVSLNITVRASDPRVQIVNHTGTQNGVASGQTAAFDIEFVGDGRPHRFDLQFVREGTNVILGSIPVVIGTPVVGEGYEFEELEDGEIHRSSHFGHYIANTAPSFAGGANQIVDEDAGAQVVAGWATNISAGPASEAGQQVTFIVTSDNPSLFSAQPTVAADGTLTFTPAADASGIANISVQLHDNGGTGIGGVDTSAPQTFSIEVNPVNDAPLATADGFSTQQGFALSTVNLLANDTDAEGDALTASLTTAAAHGTVTLQPNGSFTYTPNTGYSGSDQLTYTVSDGSLSSAAVVTIEVTPVNRAPIAAADLFTATEDTTLSISEALILANDSDPDGDSLTIALISPPEHGTLLQIADGSFLYTPAVNFNGSDSFQYELSDGQATSSIATVSISVAAINDPPVTFGESFDATEDTVLNVALPGILGNDTDVEGDLLRALLVSGPAHGTLTLTTSGTFSYIPQANFNGVDAFSYKANDGLADSNLATVRLVVAAVNDVPLAVGESYSTDQDVPLAIAPRGVLLNDSDAEGDALAAALATEPAHGTVTLSPDGSFRYAPTAGYSGVDSFTYRVSDGVASSNLATTTISITPFVPATKFFVVDATSLNSFKYASDGSAIASNALSRSDSKPRGIASNAAGTMQWVVDNGGDVFVYDNNGVLLGQWTPRNVGKPEGIAVWGRDLWIVDPTQDRVFKFAGGADLRTGRIDATSSFALNSGNLNATDVVTDGVHLWVTNDTTTDKVFRYTTAGTLEGSWTLPTTNASPTGVTLDPANVNHLWVVDAGTDRVYQYDGATTRLSGTQTASISFGLAAGNSNPQGIADPLPVVSSFILPAVLESTSAVLQPGDVSSQHERLVSKPFAPSDKQLTLASKPLPRWELDHEANLESTKLDFEEVSSRPSSVLCEFWDAALLDWLAAEDSSRRLKTT